MISTPRSGDTSTARGRHRPVPQRNCTTPSCPHPAQPGGRCTRCTTKADAARNQRRATSRAVYLSKRWKKLRRRILNERPYCEHTDPDCQRPATDVDHRIRIEDGGAPWDEDNLQALCHPHHSEKTAAETGFGGRHE